ncbi:MAG: hypothetical protein AAF513_19050 [Pseudomonadota bacterium]
MTGSVGAQEIPRGVLALSTSERTFRQVEVRSYALGLERYQLDSHTEMLGWQLSDSVYLGRQDGLDSGLTLVWQKQANQVSLSKDGLRLTRRF